MSKIIVNHKVISNQEKSLLTDKIGLIKDNLIHYHDDDVYVLVKILKGKVLLTRENNEFKISLNFDKSKASVTEYVIKNLGKTLELKTITKELIIKDNYVHVSYDLFINGSFSDSFIYELEWRCLQWAL